MGKTKWYENIGLTYSGDLKNTFNKVHDTLMFTSHMKDYMKNGMVHKIPVSTSIKVLKYFNLSPSFNFTDRTYISRTVRDHVNDTVIERDQTGFYNV